MLLTDIYNMNCPKCNTGNMLGIRYCEGTENPTKPDGCCMFHDGQAGEHLLVNCNTCFYTVFDVEVHKHSS